MNEEYLAIPIAIRDKRDVSDMIGVSFDASLLYAFKTNGEANIC